MNLSIIFIYNVKLYRKSTRTESMKSLSSSSKVISTIVYNICSYLLFYFILITSLILLYNIIDSILHYPGLKVKFQRLTLHQKKRI